MDDQDDEDFGFFDFSKLQQGFNMFDMYDNDDEKYTITDSSGTTWEVTTQELFEFYSFQDHNIMDSFENIIKKLDVVTFTTFKYWFCPECKQDLGDA